MSVLPAYPMPRSQQRPFGTIGLSVLNNASPRIDGLVAPTLPSTRGASKDSKANGYTPPDSPDIDHHLSETIWTRNARHSLKETVASERKMSKEERKSSQDCSRLQFMSSAAIQEAIPETWQELRSSLPATPPLAAAGSSAQPRACANPSPDAIDEDCPGEGIRALKRARAEAQAQSHACMEDLIGFLEMHRISGSYALAFAAHGVEDLSQLMMLPSKELDELIKKSDMDAMDEILLRGALGKGAKVGDTADLILPTCGKF